MEIHYENENTNDYVTLETVVRKLCKYKEFSLCLCVCLSVMAREICLLHV